MAAFGLWLAWRKIGALRAMLAPKPVSAGAAAVPLAACDHFHLPGPDEAARWSIRDAWAAVFAAGLRPCAGAILVLAFALSQGILWIGIAAVFAMSLGTALATSGVAALAVFFKHVAVRLAAGRGRGGAIVVRLLEIAAALAVALLGLALLSGYWVAQGGA
jgi:ABC-type nickel/cobalt efflux system permease component RcnA